MTQLVKDLFRKAGFRLERWRPSNRFDAMADTLELLKRQGFDINDSGAIPVFRDVYDFLSGRGFELYDLASIGWRQRDMRMHMLDPVFVRSDSPLCTDRAGL